MNGAPVCYQVNLQLGFGGGEVYTVFFARALAACGVATVLFAAPAATFWQDRLPPGVRIDGIAAAEDIVDRMTAVPPAWVVCHGPLPREIVVRLRAMGHRLCCFAHMPLYDRDPAPLAAYELVIPVSAHVLDSLRMRGIEQAYAEPLLGVADFPSGTRVGALRARSPYYWDKRKVRDRLLGWLAPLAEPFLRRDEYRRQEGITLGLVSRITPIKQFPRMFGLLAPILAKHPRFRLEVFGSGGYASVRDLKHALAPIRMRTRYWGHQDDMAAVYDGIDYLLTGLPEKEALGLNVIEAQARNVPVIAVAAPPFTETVADGITGLMYADPRKDGGADFERLLARLELAPFRIDVDAAQVHFARFGEDAFVARVGRLVQACRERGMLPCA
jgi:glycosyltransferase involved in cell wall biosynthesis